jgi:hypothetical protein
MNNTLLIYYPIGPTFRDRVKSNLQMFDSYKFFDILILTDDIEYFSDLNYPNVKTIDINYYRNLYPEFNNYEYIPEEKKDSGKYREQFHDLMRQGKRFSINLQRFSLLYENIDKYKFISILDCDMIPVYTEEEFNNFQHYLNEIMPVNSISTNRAYYTWNTERNLLLLDKYNKELNKNNTSFEYPIEGCDALFKIYKFENSDKVKEFFDTWNYILLDSFKTNNHLIAGSWNILVEEVLAIVYKLLNIRLNTESVHYIGVGGIKSYNFPEDRYWDDWTHRGFDVSSTSKEDFIAKNYEKLKDYYNNQGLKFTY